MQGADFWVEPQGGHIAEEDQQDRRLSRLRMFTRLHFPFSALDDRVGLCLLEDESEWHPTKSLGRMGRDCLTSRLAFKPGGLQLPLRAF